MRIELGARAGIGGDDPPPPPPPAESAPAFDADATVRMPPSKGGA